MTPEAWIGASIGAAAAAVALGAVTLARALRAEVGAPVLRYRLVGPTLAGSPVNDQRLPMSQLEPQLRHLARRGFEAVTLSEAIARRRDPGRRVALTFDGPWAAFAASVWPSLRAAGLARATLFFPPDRLGQTSLDLGGGRPEPLLPPHDLAHLGRNGLEVGVLWGRRPPEGRGERLAALRAGREKLEAAVGQPVALLALPPGVPDASLVRAARRAGFQGAALLGSSGGSTLLGRRTSPFAVPRVPIERDLPLLDFAAALGRAAPCA